MSRHAITGADRETREMRAVYARRRASALIRPCVVDWAVDPPELVFVPDLSQAEAALLAMIPTDAGPTTRLVGVAAATAPASAPAAHPGLAEHVGIGLAPGHAHPFAGDQDPRLTDSRPPLAHGHADGDLPSTIARTADVAAAVAAHAAGPHGGSAGPWTTILKTADESKNALAAVADDVLLKFTTQPNTAYSIRLRAWFLTNATADLKYRLFHAGTTTRVRRRILRTGTTDVAQVLELKTAFDAADVVLATTGLNPWLEEHVLLQVGATGGLFVLRWAQVASNPGPTTCLEGSYLEYAVT